MANHDEFRELISLYMTKGLDPAQKRRLTVLLEDPANVGLLEDEMRESFFAQGVLTEASDETVDGVMSRLPLHFSSQARIRKFSYGRWLVAATLAGLVAGAVYLLVRPGHSKELNEGVAKGGQQDVQPARKGAALLKLANGQIIDVQSAGVGVIARQGNIEIIKDKDGQIRYKGSNEGEVLFNEILTEKGEEQSVGLPDGSVASLNAASSIRYPLSFRNGERLVSMTGEVHFLVEHDVKMPFRVRVKEQTIEDLGTEFNINAYEEERKVTTTLVEGAVSIKKGTEKVLLKPGQEGVTSSATDRIDVSAADMDLNLAWYRGVFSYKHADIPTIMREFARWYNVEVIYQDGKIPDASFSGDMGRNLTLTQALEGLKKIGIRYRINENKQIVILP